MTNRDPKKGWHSGEWMRSPEFYKELVSYCGKIGLPPEDLLLVMVSESGLDPSARNPKGSATGLIQFMGDTMKGLGMPDRDTVSSMQDVEQMKWVEKFIDSNNNSVNGGRGFVSAAHLYVCIMWPAALRRIDPAQVKSGNLNYILISKDKNPKAYASNPIDLDGDGAITLKDLHNHLNKKRSDPRYVRAVEEMKKATGAEVSSRKPDETDGNEKKPAKTYNAQEIQNLQKALNKAGYSPKLQVNGAISEELNNAIIWFRQGVGLSAAAVIDKDLIEKLNERLGASSKKSDRSENTEQPEQSNANSANIINLKKLLNNAGASPKLDNSGIIDDNLVNAIKQFQAKNDLPETGQLSPEFINKLKQTYKSAIYKKVKLIKHANYVGKKYCLN